MELVRELGKVAGYKIDEHKLVALVYTNNSMAERELVRTIPFKIAEKNLKYLEINLTTDVKDHYDKNYKALKNK